MTRPGPIKHCRRCGSPMMVQVHVCHMCGGDNPDKYDGPHPAWLCFWGVVTFTVMAMYPMFAVLPALIWGARIGEADAALRALMRRTRS